LKVLQVVLNHPADVRSPHPLDDYRRGGASMKFAEGAQMRELFQTLLFRTDGLQVA
jgi:hypothetical protein